MLEEAGFECGAEGNGRGSESRSWVGFGIRGVVPSGCATRDAVIWLLGVG
jgi:hypothetical protein